MIIFLTIALVAVYISAYQSFEGNRSIQEFEEIEMLISDSLEQTEEKSEQEIAYEKYQALLAENNDFIGWIKIEGTNVNYPVMQTVDNPNFYLKHNFEKEYSDYGVPYLDEECFVDLTNNLVIYGHNMKNGTMFTDLVNYKDKDFWEEHQTINFDTMAEFNEYQIMYAFTFDTNNETFCYNDYTNMDEEQFAEFIAECEKRMAYDTGIRAEFGDEILTLSTCEYTHENGRFVVVAKKVVGEAVTDEMTETPVEETVESKNIE
jgi:sortase B